jgi:hypothetical protein
VSRVYTQDLLSGSGVGSVVVPTGDVWVIRDISGTIDTSTMLGPGGIGFSAIATQFYVYATTPNRFDTFHWEGRVAVPEAETIAAYLFSDPSVSFIMTGYTLTLP